MFDSGVCNQHDVLCDRQSIELNSKPCREALVEEADGFDYGNEMEAENIQRTKRNEQKGEIDLPPGYSIFEIPKLADGSPLPIFLHLNISKILRWDELNEVTISTL